MPEYTDKTWQESADRIQRGRVLADDYSQTNSAPYPKRQHWVPGMPISWETLGGQRYEGIVLEVEEGVAKVECTDGVTRAVELD